MDFLQVKSKTTKRGNIEIYPDYKVIKSKDLMVRGQSFYAIFNNETGLWDTDEYIVPKMIDSELQEYANTFKTEDRIDIKKCTSFNSRSWTEFKMYMKSLSDSNHTLDDKLTWQNTVVQKKDYVSKRLPYSLEEGDYSAWDQLISTLYDEEERNKIEWAIGSIVDGDSKSIQKFLVLFGDAGSGKSTILNVIQLLFEGYYTMFNARALGASNNNFATESFRKNPLVAIQHDGDLSKIEDNTLLNSIVSHELMEMHEKYKSAYNARVNCFLFMATNKPVKITDSKSGIIRRLIDVHPSGRKLDAKTYNQLMDRIKFELGAIATHCLEVYRDLGKHYYDSYRPLDMMLRTDLFFNFVDDRYFELSDPEYITLKRAYLIYKEYCDEVGVTNILPQYKFRDELRAYYKAYYDQKMIDGERCRSVFGEFNKDKFVNKPLEKENHVQKVDSRFVFDDTDSLLDILAADYPAQLTNSKGYPLQKWTDVKSTLKDLDTHTLHFVKLPINHIVIDFDIKDDNGNKSYAKNLEAASAWPLTYAELSKSEAGIHLHYIYDGDPNELASEYADDIEIKVYKGNSSLRRKLTRCNHAQIAHLSDGSLPKKENTKVINFEGVKNEKAIRTMIKKNLNKEYHNATKPSVDFIKTILDKAYEDGLHYDVTDMRPAIMAFAMNSTNNADYCIKATMDMKYKSEEPSMNVDSNEPIVFYDVEVFPNLFVIVYKLEGDHDPVKLINPTPEQVTELMKYKLVGFNCRRYDNHILYARVLGYSNEQLYKLSSKIVNGSKNCMFGEAYNISYTDIYDYASKKQSLKKWEIELDIHHQECGLPWDKPVPEELFGMVADYCINDVVSTEEVWKATKEDFVARQILADISGLSVNDTTNSHTGKIIFGNEKNPQKDFVYTDLSEMFPGYEFDHGKSTYRGEETGEGGYVYAEPGIYTDVALLDIASMHPSSIENLNLFGPYTKTFSDIKSARIYIKHNEFDKAGALFDGKLKPYLVDESQSKALSYALKIVINSVYGLTSAKFDNRFKDPRNIDNIVAKRGALFMINLKHEVQERGYTVAHIKTDSIKIPNADQYIIDFVMEYGKQYGYVFEHEATYDRMCLVNNAVYIAKYKEPHNGEWTATGAEFQHPYVFKKLFSHEDFEFKDYCEAKSVTSALYLDFNENLKDGEHDYRFVGKVGNFIPIRNGNGAALLMREKDGKYSYATGTKGYRWLEAETVKGTNLESAIDISYHEKLVEDAIDHIKSFGDYYSFVS